MLLAHACSKDPLRGSAGHIAGQHPRLVLERAVVFAGQRRIRCGVPFRRRDLAVGFFWRYRAHFGSQVQPVNRPMGEPMRHFRFPIVFLSLYVLSLAAHGQSDPRQAICEASWESCLGATGDGKNWKPVYDRCLKARTACLGGRAYQPQVQHFSAVLPRGAGSGSDPGNADSATQGARCARGETRGLRDTCVLADAGEGYGQTFSLLGPGVPLSRVQRASSVVKCAGGNAAMFYPNGRIESCMLDAGGVAQTPLTDYAGKVANCAPRTLVRFDPEGRLLSCDRN